MRLNAESDPGIQLTGVSELVREEGNVVELWTWDVAGDPRGEAASS